MLARKLLRAQGKYPAVESRRVKRQRIVKEGELEKAVTAAALDPECTGVLVVLDADTDCPATLGPVLAARAAGAATHVQVGVVLAKVEFEAWVLAGIEGARGRRGIRDDATCTVDPDEIRNPKAVLESLMVDRTYLETDDQAALAELFDETRARERSRSFRKLEKELESVAAYE